MGYEYSIDKEQMTRYFFKLKNMEGNILSCYPINETNSIQRLSIIDMLVEKLKYYHCDLGIQHGDICLENIFIDDQRKNLYFIRLKSVESRQGSSSISRSTKETDIFQLSLVFYFILTGGQKIQQRIEDDLEKTVTTKFNYIIIIY